VSMSNMSNMSNNSLFKNGFNEVNKTELDLLIKRVLKKVLKQKLSEIKVDDIRDFVIENDYLKINSFENIYKTDNTDKTDNLNNLKSETKNIIDYELKINIYEFSNLCKIWAVMNDFVLETSIYVVDDLKNEKIVFEYIWCSKIAQKYTDFFIKIYDDTELNVCFRAIDLILLKMDKDSW